MSQAAAQPKSKRARRILQERAPKVFENVKKSLLLRGPKTSSVVTDALKDLHKLKQPESKMFAKKNVTRPFEDQSSVEFLCQTNDTSLFAYGSHSKKRPHNLVMGRTFDGAVLDMFEFTIEEATFKSMADMGERKCSVRYGSKPMFVFQGEEFEGTGDLAVFKSLLVDYFRGEVVPKINLAGLDHVIVCTASGQKVWFRHYGILLKKSGSKVPRVELEEVGPHMDLLFRRRKQAAEEINRNAYRVPKESKVHYGKNVMKEGEMGDKTAIVHPGRQDLSKMALRKHKGRKRPLAEANGEKAEQAAEADASNNASGNAAEDSGAPSNAKRQRVAAPDDGDAMESA